MPGLHVLLPFWLCQFPMTSFFELASCMMTYWAFLHSMDDLFSNSDPADSIWDTFGNFPCMHKRRRAHWNSSPDRRIPCNPHSLCHNHPLDKPDLHLPIHPTAPLFFSTPPYKMSMNPPDSSFLCATHLSFPIMTSPIYPLPLIVQTISLSP